MSSPLSVLSSFTINNNYYQDTKNKLFKSPFINPVIIVTGSIIITFGVVGGIYLKYKQIKGYYRSDISLEDAFTEDDLNVFNNYNNFMISGCSASGKTTLCNKIDLKIEKIHRIDLDELYWLPNWKHNPDEIFNSNVQKEFNKYNKNGWIIDGDYSEARHTSWSNAQVVIFLDYDFWVCFWRAVKRTSYRVITGQQVCNGNYETFYSTCILCNPEFGGIAGSVWVNYPRYKKRIKQWTKDYPHIKCVTIPSPYHCEYWLNKAAQ